MEILQGRMRRGEHGVRGDRGRCFPAALVIGLGIASGCTPSAPGGFYSSKMETFVQHSERRAALASSEVRVLKQKNDALEQSVAAARATAADADTQAAECERRSARLTASPKHAPAKMPAKKHGEKELGDKAPGPTSRSPILTAPSTGGGGDASHSASDAPSETHPKAGGDPDAH